MLIMFRLEQGLIYTQEHPEETAHAWAPRQLVIVCGRCRGGKQQC